MNQNSIQENPPIKISNSYDEETGLYYLKDESTGEIIYASEDENDPSFDFYIEHPDYNPNPLSPKKTRLEEYIVHEEIAEE